MRFRERGCRRGGFAGFSFMQDKVLRGLVGRQRLAFSRAKRRDSDRETEREELELRML